MATWLGTFDKRKNTASGTKVGRVNLKWMEVDEVLFEVTEEYDGSEAPQVFKTRINNLRDIDLARQAESVTITGQLNTLMNG